MSHLESIATLSILPGMGSRTRRFALEATQRVIASGRGLGEAADADPVTVAMAQAQRDEFFAEADRDVAIAREQGNVSAAFKLLDGAWARFDDAVPNQYPDQLAVNRTSQAQQRIHDEGQDKYGRASNMISSYERGAGQIAAASNRAQGAVVQQNVDYEASGQAAADRKAEADRIRRYSSGGSSLKMAIDSFGDTGGDTGVARQAGGKDTGWLGTSGEYYQRQASDAGDWVKKNACEAVGGTWDGVRQACVYDFTKLKKILIAVALGLVAVGAGYVAISSYARGRATRTNSPGRGRRSTPCPPNRRPRPGSYYHVSRKRVA